MDTRDMKKIETQFEIAHKTRSQFYESWIMFLYLKKKMILANENDLNFVWNLIDDDEIKIFCNEFVSSFTEEQINKIIELIPNNLADIFDICLYIGTYINSFTANQGEFSTPSYLINLCLAILDPESGSSFADVCSGYGSVAVAANKLNSSLSIAQVDISLHMLIISKMRCEILDTKCEFINRSWFDCDKKFDRIFIDYPYNILARNDDSISVELFDELNLSPDTKLVNQNALFLLKTLKQLEDNGKAIAFCTKGFSNNVSDAAWRKILIEGGYVEAVISLTDGLLPTTSIPINILLLSRNNDSIKFIDGTSIYSKKGTRLKYLSDKDINRLINEFQNMDNGISKVLDAEYLSNNEYCLDAERELSRPLDLDNGQELSSLVTSISRGYQISKTLLREISSSAPTKNKYLMVKDLDSYLDFSKLNSLTKIETSLERYCLKENDIVLSKTGPRYRVSIVRHLNDYKVLATGNVYIIRATESKIDPLFLKLFLESELGQKQLKSLSTGSTIISLQQTGLNHLIVPVPELDVQKSISEKYESLLEKIYLHRSAIAKLKQEIEILL